MPVPDSARRSTARPQVTLVTRPWDHLAPLLAGEVDTPGFELQLRCVDTTPNPWADAELDGGEASFSGYVRACASGDDSMVGLPAFLMRAFRHRCLLVRTDSPLTALEHLHGARIGLTGWPDSGNTWTRALLRRAGVDLSQVQWTVAPLTTESMIRPQAALPPHAREATPGMTLVDGLVQGHFDAIMAPFMPPQLHQPNPPVRHLLPDYPIAESAYFAEVGFVPGIHLAVLRADLVDRHPWLPAQLLVALEQSKRLWQSRRRFYADTTPWVLADFATTDAVVGGDWMPYGIEQNAEMVRAFCTELAEQQLTPEPIHPSTLFPDALFAHASQPVGTI